jgi:ADP-ribosylglycohydrolase
MKNPTVYRKKVLGAWLGKSVGGTLGAAWEGSTGPLNLSYYNPVPTAMLPNDDLDLQVVWACRLASDWNGIISKGNFSKAWLENIGFAYDEYGVAIRNLKRGIPAPHSGMYDNFFTDGLGAAIRAEIWACLAPGNPRLAADFAYEDACVDHFGNGIYAEQFIAALESLAFEESDIPVLIEKALAVIPANSKLANGIRDSVQWTRKGDFSFVRSEILAKYGSYNFTDVCMCVPFMTAALILGQGDFSASICHAVNFGRDTDCTGATVGAVLGIIHPDSIPEKWLAPIEHTLILNKEITGLTYPDTLDEFTDLIVGLREKVVLKQTTVPVPDLTAFEISCKVSAYSPWFALDYRKFSPVVKNDAKKIRLPGNIVNVDFTDLPPESLHMMEIPFTMPQTQTARVLVNSTADMRVWLDGEYLFGREGGEMLPAFHRAPANQLEVLTLSKGVHTLRIGLAPVNEQMKSAPLVFGVADEHCFWLV